jgi:hypothetical protein
MAEAGCVEVSLGFESGCPKVLEAMNKRFGPAEVRETSDRLAAHGIRRLGFLLLGGPGETKETVDDFTEPWASARVSSPSMTRAWGPTWRWPMAECITCRPEAQRALASPYAGSFAGYPAGCGGIAVSVGAFLPASQGLAGTDRHRRAGFSARRCRAKKSSISFQLSGL